MSKSVLHKIGDSIELLPTKGLISSHGAFTLLNVFSKQKSFLVLFFVECKMPVGLSTGIIADSQIKASDFSGESRPRHPRKPPPATVSLQCAKPPTC